MSVQVQYASANVPRVRPHVQAFADEADKHAGVQHFGTYNGHEPTPDRALDCFPKSKAEGDRLAAWAIKPEVMAYYGIDYVIWYQRIYNPEIAPYWRDMADRGGATANHKDHVHVSFNPTAPAGAIPQPEPLPQPQEDDEMYLIYDKGRNLVFVAVGGKLRHVKDPKDVESLKAAGLKDIALTSDLVKSLEG